MIRARHLFHRLGGRLVLEDLSLDVADGETLALAGPNGAGKSTLLRILATLVEPTAGELEIHHVDAVRDPERARHHLAFLPDQAALDPELTAHEHLTLFAAAYRVDPAVLDGVLELTELAPRADHPIRDLSAGARRRLALGTLLLHDPAVLLLDDPAAGLDPRGRAELDELLLELRRLGRTIVLATHAPSLLPRSITRVAPMDHGRLAPTVPLP